MQYPLASERLGFGVFAIIPYDEAPNRVLIKKRADGLWDLPGGAVDSKIDSDPLHALCRRVNAETTLTVTYVDGRVGNPLPFFDEKSGKLDIAIAYLCRVRGVPRRTKETPDFAWVGINEAVGIIRNPTERSLVGPRGRVGRMARMLLDGLVIGLQPDNVIHDSAIAIGIPVSPDYQEFEGGRQLICHNGSLIRVWYRPDPFTKSGNVE